jgi:hypothetical protein
MMTNFMVSWSLTRGTWLNNASGESDAMPFPGEDAVMMICDGLFAPCV